MIGSKYIEINWKNWVQGMSSSNFTQDGGFARGTGLTDGNVSTINPLITPGLLNFPALPTDKSTNLSGQVIASSEDTTGTYSRLLVARTEANGDGTFYTAASDGTLTARGSADSSHDYIQGKTDIISFDTKAYVTTDSTIVEWTLPATFNTSWFTFADAAAPHPALVFENNAFYGDGNELLRSTPTGSGGATPAVILTLPGNQVIVALGIDPGSGKMVVSVIDELNASGTLNAQARVGYYDGFSNKFIKVVLADEMITCFFNVGGTLFIGYGQKFGYWTGTGIQFLRRINISLDNTELIYKHHITNIGQVLYFLEKNKILAFGEIMQGKGRSWWYLYQNLPAGSAVNLTFVTYLSSNLLAFSYATSKFFTLDTSSVASIDANSLVFSFKYTFPRPVTFNSLVIDYPSPITQSTTIATVYLFTDNSNQPLIATVTTPRTDLQTFNCDYPTVQTRSIEIRYIASLNTAIERWLITYNDKE